MKKKPIVLTIIIILLMLIGFGIYKAISKSRVPAVTVITPENHHIIASVSATGEVLSQNQANLSFSANGTITKLYAKEGDFVKKGSILAKLNTYTTNQSAKSARDARDIALRNKDLFLEQYADNKDAAGGKNEYNIKLRTLNEQISLATANYNAANGQLSNYYIKAPFDGTIIATNHKVGEVVAATQVIYQIADLTDLYFETYVDQEDFGSIKIGQEANITLDAYPNKQLLATVYELSSYANPNDTFTVKLKFDVNESIKPLVGMTGDIKLITKESTNNVNSLAFDEYFKDQTSTYIWTLNERNQLKKVPIDIGIEGDVYTEIKTDISGYKIVLPTKTDIELEDGLTVKIDNK